LAQRTFLWIIISIARHNSKDDLPVKEDNYYASLSPRSANAVSLELLHVNAMQQHDRRFFHSSSNGKTDPPPREEKEVDDATATHKEASSSPASSEQLLRTLMEQLRSPHPITLANVSTLGTFLPL
jgi:hypothetical protein